MDFNKHTYNNSYRFYKKLSKAEQLEKYRVIEPLIIACRDAGHKNIHYSVAANPKYRKALMARQELFLSLNGLIASLALNRGVKAEELDDLFSYCTIFLDKALMRFDYERGFAFTSFAFVYLKGAILNFIRQNNLIVLSAKDFQDQDVQVTYSNLEVNPTELDAHTTDYILSLLSDTDARLITWYFNLNATSQYRDSLIDFLTAGIDCTQEAIDSIILSLQGILSDV
jgi:RNA polymerase sigma factor (sigma-70 family)